MPSRSNPADSSGFDSSGNRKLGPSSSMNKERYPPKRIGLLSHDTSFILSDAAIVSDFVFSFDLSASFVALCLLGSEGVGCWLSLL
ncbi:hypothetical protein D5086_002324 [Populus alba]|uniref:Uncharacterized protein n=1 Tax=Populus alba TaxID=43335 RepID=A0ACC4D2L4_POPAL